MGQLPGWVHAKIIEEHFAAYNRFDTDAIMATYAPTLTYCHNVTLGRRDFYRHLCHALGIAYGATAGDVFVSVSKHVEDLARERTLPVLLVEEAHLLHQDTLDHLHILLNSWDSRSLLSLILIGSSGSSRQWANERNERLSSPYR